MAMTELTVHTQDGVAVLTLDRPQRRNALTAAVRAAIAETMTRLGAGASGGALGLDGQLRHGRGGAAVGPGQSGSPARRTAPRGNAARAGRVLERPRGHGRAADPVRRQRRRPDRHRPAARMAPGPRVARPQVPAGARRRARGRNPRTWPEPAHVTEASPAAPQ